MLTESLTSQRRPTERPQKLVYASASASLRVERGVEFLVALGSQAPAIVLGASLDASAQVTRLAALRTAGGFGWHRFTVGRLAFTWAGQELGERGLTPVGRLPLEAIAARIVHRLGARGLGRFGAIADRPGLPRALARTLDELRMAGLRSASVSDPALSTVLAAYEEELQRAALADRAEVLRIATDRLQNGPRVELDSSAVLLLDVPMQSVRERELVLALARGAPRFLATMPAGDERALEQLRALPCVGVESAAAPASASALARLQAGLFSPTAALGTMDDDVVLLSAPGESRECVEIARRVQREAERGVPFDRMAILLRAPAQYRAHLEEALRRAGVPAHFARGTVQARSRRARVPGAARVRRGGPLGAALRRVPLARRGGRRRPATARRPLPAARRALGAARRRAIAARGAGPRQRPRPRADGATEARRAGETAHARHAARAAALGAAARRSGRDRRPRALGDAARRASRKLVDLDRKALRDSDEAAGRALASRPRGHRRAARLRAPAPSRFAGAGATHARGAWGNWLDRLSALWPRARCAIPTACSRCSPSSADGGRRPGRPQRGAPGARAASDSSSSCCPKSGRFGRVFVAAVEAARGLSFDVVFVPGLAEKNLPAEGHRGSDPAGSRARSTERLARRPTTSARPRAARAAPRGGRGARAAIVSYPRVDLEQSRPRTPSFYGLEVLRAAEGKLPGFDELARRAESVGGARIGWPAPRARGTRSTRPSTTSRSSSRVFERPEAETVGTARYLLSANRAPRARPSLPRAALDVQKWTRADGLVEPHADARAALAAHAPRRAHRSRRPRSRTSRRARTVPASSRPPPRAARRARGHRGARSRCSAARSCTRSLFELLGELARRGSLPVTDSQPRAARARASTQVLDAVAARYHDDLAPAIERVWEDGIASIRADLREWLRRAAEASPWAPAHFELSFGLDASAARAIRQQGRAGRARRAGSSCAARSISSSSAPPGPLRATDYKTGKVRAKDEHRHRRRRDAAARALRAALEKLFPASAVEQRAALLLHVGRRLQSTSTSRFDDEAREAAALVVRDHRRGAREGFLARGAREGRVRSTAIIARCAGRTKSSARAK